MKALLLSALLMVPSIHCISKAELEQQRLDLEIQKEGDDLKIKVALITAAVTIMLIWLRGKGDDAATFDTMMLDILKK